MLSVFPFGFRCLVTDRMGNGRGMGGDGPGMQRKRTLLDRGVSCPRFCISIGALPACYGVQRPSLTHVIL